MIAHPVSFVSYSAVKKVLDWNSVVEAMARAYSVPHESDADGCAKWKSVAANPVCRSTRCALHGRKGFWRRAKN